jgi:hypothetical protein
MKMRLQFVEITVMDFQPFIGFEVQIDEAMLLEYQTVLRALLDLQPKLTELLKEQAVACDAQTQAWRERKGLSLLPGGEGGRENN